MLLTNSKVVQRYCLVGPICLLIESRETRTQYRGENIQGFCTLGKKLEVFSHLVEIRCELMSFHLKVLFVLRRGVCSKLSVAYVLSYFTFCDFQLVLARIQLIKLGIN